MTSPREPIAIVGMANLYPAARGVAEYWTLFDGSAPRRARADLSDVVVDLAKFRIPPVQRGSMTRLQVLMLEAAQQCLTDAGYAERPRPAERTDVVVGTCFGLDRQYANALRVEGVRYARELERAALIDHDDRIRRGAEQLSAEMRTGLVRTLGASSHDRVGEMASTIPARIAAAFRLLGRTIAVESTDATSFVALAHAVENLRAGSADAVLVLTGQSAPGVLVADALAAKGLGPPAEGVTALLLKRESSAVRDGDRRYASVLECALRHDPRPGTLRYSTSADARYLVATQCHQRAGISAEQVRYIDLAGPELPAVAEAERKGLSQLLGDAAPASVVLGRAADRLGYTFADAGLASVAKTALALHHRRLPHSGAAEVWPAAADSGTRHAAVCGSALGGTLAYLLLEGRDTRARVTVSSRPPSAEPIAIVGYGGCFAGAPDAASFWRNIRSGRDGLRPLPEAVLDRDLYYAPGEIALTRSYCEVGGALPIPDRPPAALPLTPRRYRAMDPAQRLTLAVADEVLARYGRREALTGRPAVVAIGSTLSLTSERRGTAYRSVQRLEAVVAGLASAARLPADGLRRILQRARQRYAPPGDSVSPVDLDGCLASGVAAHVGNEYGLAAHPVAVEAACASALAALDFAVTALRLGAVDYAVAGGVELACNTRDLVLCSALGLLSHSRITPFDAAADGFSPGDGCALFLLKRLSDARRDGDEIVALIRGIGASNDAKSLIAPDVDGQVRAMRRAFGQVEFDPGAVDYLEAHGTGTRVGDRVELTATARVYGTPRRARPLVVGSAKAFAGHTFAAAGGAGLLMALQAMLARTYPPNPSLRTPGPDLPIEAIPALLPTAATPWPAAAGRPRRAGVSSFGTGGINYHLLLEEYRQDGAR